MMTTTYRGADTREALEVLRQDISCEGEVAAMNLRFDVFDWLYGHDLTLDEIVDQYRTVWFERFGLCTEYVDDQGELY